MADEAEIERCTGHCCRRFPIDLDVLTDPTRNVLDGDFIRDMLIELGPHEDPNRIYATCRHFDGRDCTAYDQRPDMCRRYPYGRACEYAGCTRRVSP